LLGFPGTFRLNATVPNGAMTNYTTGMHTAHAATGPGAEIWWTGGCRQQHAAVRPPDPVGAGTPDPCPPSGSLSRAGRPDLVCRAARAGHEADRRASRPRRVPAPACGYARRRHLDDQDHPGDGRRMAGVRRLRHRPRAGDAGRRPISPPASSIPSTCRRPTALQAPRVRGVHPANRVGSWSPSELAFPVARDGQPVNDLDPYLGAHGRLVALRDRESRGAAPAPRRHPDPGASISLGAALPQPWPLPALAAIPASGHGPDRRLHAEIPMPERIHMGHTSS
jgi:hypothetical protein